MTKTNKRIVLGVASLIASLSIATLAYAAIPATTTPTSTASPAPKMRMGIVDVHDILDHSSHIAEMKTALKKQFDSKQKEMITQQKALDAKLARFKRDEKVMTKKEATKLEEEIAQDKHHLQTLQIKFQQELFKAQDEAMTKLLDAFKAKTAAIAKKDNLDVVLTKSSTIYVASQYDITGEVRKAFK